MAIRFDNDLEYYQRTTGLPAFTAVTICGWVKLSIDKNNYASPFSLDDGDTSDYLTLYTDPDGTSLNVQGQHSGGFTDAALRSLTVGGWYFLAIKCDGSTVTGYAIAAGETAVTKASVTTSIPFGTTNRLWFGSNVWAEGWNGLIAAVKVYDAVLTDNEVMAEMNQYLPVRTANLNSFYPFLTKEDAGDYSGNGRTLTLTGTVANEDGPPIAWSRARGRRMFIPAAAGGSGGTATVTGSQATGATGTAVAHGAASATGTGSQGTGATGAAVAHGAGGSAPSGSQGTGATGTVVGTGAGAAAPSGTQGSGGTGTCTGAAEGSCSASGSQASTATGNAGSSGNAVVTVTGSQGTGATGTVTAASVVAVLVTGSQGTGSTGNVLAQGAALIVVTGSQGSASAGIVRANGGEVISGPVFAEFGRNDLGLELESEVMGMEFEGRAVELGFE